MSQPNDLHDRLLDTALREVAGGHAPPDFSARILAAAENSVTPIEDTKMERPTRTRRVWFAMAIAACLFVGAGFLIPAMQRARESAKRAEAEAHLRDAATAIEYPRFSKSPTPLATSEPATTPNLPSPYYLSDDVQYLESGAPIAYPSQEVWKGMTDERRKKYHPVHKPEYEKQAQASNRELADAITSTVAPVTVAEAEAPMALTDSSMSLLGRISPTGSKEVLIQNPEGGGQQVPGIVIGDGEERLSVLSDIHSPINRGYLEGGGQSAPYARDRNVTNLYSEFDQEELGRLALDERNFDWRRVPTPFDPQAQNSPEGRGPGEPGDQYTRIYENPFIEARGEQAVSTFSIDVDTASYANVRQFLESNQLPPPDAVRLEELINYFDYQYEPPAADSETPFSAAMEVASCPWEPKHRLVRIALQGRELEKSKRPVSNLVFLIDVSGSMDEPNKLPLVVEGMKQLVRELGENDRVAIIVYASSEGLVLPSTPGTKQATILESLDRLQAGGSTAGGAGIQLAYQMAEDNFVKGGVNRVILCTDGDFNVGVTSTADLERMVEQKANDTKVFLSVLGFGRGNLNDAMMETISNRGNGNYHYVDNLTEARKVLVEEMTGTLVTIAKDVKIQVEFNPAQVAGYRLLGYENRMLRTEDFNDDKKDAGEIGAGHRVTALYEIVPAGEKVDVPPVDDLKYQQPAKPGEAADSKELLTLKLRYKQPDGDTSTKIEFPLTDEGKSFSAATPDFKFATAVASFGMLLRGSQYKGNATYDAVLEIATEGAKHDPHGYRAEFLELVQKAKGL